MHHAWLSLLVARCLLACCLESTSHSCRLAGWLVLSIASQPVASKQRNQPEVGKVSFLFHCLMAVNTHMRSSLNREEARAPAQQAISRLASFRTHLTSAASQVGTYQLLPVTSQPSSYTYKQPSSSIATKIYNIPTAGGRGVW